MGADISGHVGTDAEGYEDGGQGFGDRNDRGGRTIIGNCPGFESGHTSRKQKSTESRTVVEEVQVRLTIYW